jgi:hypothetical protein
MLKALRGAAVAAVATLGTLALAHAEGMFSKLPIVEGGAYCALYAGDGTTCAANVPAGPTAVTGNEKIPADTRLSQGQNPQTVLFSMASLNALPLTVATITTNPQTVTAAATSGGVLLRNNGGGTVMTAVTINLPTAPIDGQQFAVSGDANVTTLTLTAQNLPAGVIIKNNPTGITTSTTASYGYRFMYNLANNAWFRLQ